MVNVYSSRWLFIHVQYKQYPDAGLLVMDSEPIVSSRRRIVGSGNEIGWLAELTSSQSEHFNPIRLLVTTFNNSSTYWNWNFIIHAYKINPDPNPNHNNPDNLWDSIILQYSYWVYTPFGMDVTIQKLPKIWP